MPERVAASCICELIGGNGADQILGPAAGHISLLANPRPAAPVPPRSFASSARSRSSAQASSPA